ncbi:MAG TPA: hypothetical protein VGV93_05740 [Acidimicrobiales bacterium]|nr:hypothetical protein [Acidimicrobiales bacterium]
MGASSLVVALEQAWAGIARAHSDVPPAVIVLASGTTGRAVKLGHYAASRWEVAGSETAEVLDAGEGLRLGAVEALGTLLHEAAHGVAHARGVTDTSRGGRYHNRRYAAIAGELGLVAVQHPTLGWAQTTLASGTPERFAGELAAIEAALQLWRRAEATGTGAREDRPSSPASARAGGACGRRGRYWLRPPSSVEAVAAGLTRTRQLEQETTHESGGQVLHVDEYLHTLRARGGTAGVVQAVS